MLNLRKQNPEMSDRLAFLVEFMNLGEATGDPDAQWEPYQVAFLNSTDTLTSDLKSRQVGWSFIAAADAAAHATLVPRSTSIFTSMNRNEAAEKVRYASYCIEALDEDVRPVKVIENRQEIELSNGSRIISHPCRPIRGKARARVYLDEMAHYPNADEIYTAVVPVITRGGVIRIGSSPLGATGKFYEIHSEALAPYPGYRRMAIPWWVSAHLCKDLARARVEAPRMSTEERVRAFGKPRLIFIFENMLLADFQQEYECYWSDESIAWLSWEEIKRNQAQDLAENHIYFQEIVPAGDTLERAKDAIDALARAIDRGAVPPELYGGYDVGRKRNLSEFILVSREGDDESPVSPYRLGISMDRMEFDDQEEIVAYSLQKLPIYRMLIDKGGLGMGLSESLENRFYGTVEGVEFTAPLKEAWSVELKIRFQQARAPIPIDRELANQIHSIRKKASSGYRALFDTETSEKHHADKYWALALAHNATLHFGTDIGMTASPMSGYRG